jgi:hypothetical protein
MSAEDSPDLSIHQARPEPDPGGGTGGGAVGGRKATGGAEEEDPVEQELRFELELVHRILEEAQEDE